MSFLEYIIAAIAPYNCLQCGVEGDLLCASCQLAVYPPAPSCYRCGRLSHGATTCPTCSTAPIAQLLCVAPFTGVIKQLVHDLKFNRRRAAALPMAAMLARYCKNTLTERPDIVVYIPTATNRVRSRGYDQAQRIATELARLLDVPTAALLYRRGQQRQVGKGRALRLQQMSQAFWLPQPNTVTHKHILLVDDVLTTGASFEAAAAVLHAAGARRISGAAFAAAQKQSGAVPNHLV